MVCVVATTEESWFDSLQKYYSSKVHTDSRAQARYPKVSGVFFPKSKVALYFHQGCI